MCTWSWIARNSVLMKDYVQIFGQNRVAKVFVYKRLNLFCFISFWSWKISSALFFFILCGNHVSQVLFLCLVVLVSPFFPECDYLLREKVTELSGVTSLKAIVFV